MKRYGLALPLAALLAVTAVPVTAQDVSSLVDRINRLERNLNDLQRSFYAGSPPTTAGAPAGAPLDAGAQAAIPNLLTKVQQLESQLRTLTGRVEELGYQVQRTSEHMEKLQADTNMRLQTLEGGMSPVDSSDAAPSSPPPPAATAPSTGSGPQGSQPTLGAGPRPLGQLSQAEAAQSATTQPKPSAGGGSQQAALPQGPIEAQYQAAFDYLVRHDYDRAEQAFQSFIKAHPNDPLAGNAQYWLGETYYVRQRYEDAAVAFLEGYQKYPKSAKAADNLLKLGMALGQVGQPAEACATFGRLQKEFPDAPTNIKRRLVQETQRLKCAS